MGYGPLPGAPDPASVLVPGPWTHRTVRANGIALHVAEAGEGPLVLLLHGFPQFWWAWRRQLTALAAAGYRAVAVDLRGHGASDKPPRGYDAPNLAEDMAALVSALGESRAVVVGHDLGGLLGWTMAARRPDVVQGLVVLGAAHPLRLRTAVRRDAAQRHASGYALRTFQLPRRPEHLLAQDSQWVRELVDRWSGPAWRAAPDYEQVVERYAAALRIHPAYYCVAEYFRWLVRSLPRGDGRRFADSLRAPVRTAVLQLHGTLDTCVLPGTVVGSERWVSGAYETTLLEGVGHFPHDEAPDRVSAEIVRWADRVTGRAAT